MMQSLSRKNFWIITINSSASFVLAYMIVFYLNQLSYVLTAGMFGYPVTLNHASYFFHIEPYQWTHDAVFIIFSSGYILTFILGVLSLLAFMNLTGSSAPVKVLFLWLVLHSSNFVFGGLLLGNLLTEGIGHVFNWMYLLDTPRMIISISGFFGLLITALMSARWFSISADAYFTKYNERMAPFFITAQVLLPFLIGSVLVFFYYFPKGMFHEKYGWAVLAVMMFIFFMRAKFLDDLIFEEDDARSIRPMKGLVVFTVLVFVLSRVLLSRGFTFGL